MGAGYFCGPGAAELNKKLRDGMTMAEIREEIMLQNLGAEDLPKELDQPDATPSYLKRKSDFI